VKLTGRQPKKEKITGKQNGRQTEKGEKLSRMADMQKDRKTKGE
jgi:hypothetical protein